MAPASTTPPTGPEGLVRVPAVAQHFNSSPREIYRLAKAGRIPGYRVGRGWRFKLSECEAALREAP